MAWVSQEKTGTLLYLEIYDYFSYFAEIQGKLITNRLTTAI